jgi:hypothetical protein
MTDIQKVKKIILFKGQIETLGYFSEQLSKVFVQMGYEVYMFDFANSYQGINDLIWFCEKENTVMITFNFIGINEEDIFVLSNGELFWNQREILCVNIIVDHPFYYHEFFKKPPLRYVLFCIDKNHVRYMERFFPTIQYVSFLPLAGTQISDVFIPYEDREYDILFTGNYTPPYTFDKYINRIDEDYACFYNKIIDDLVHDPGKTIEEAIEKQTRLDINGLTEEDLKNAFASMIFIDLYVRFHFRALAVKTLVDNGFRVDVYGSGWDLLDCRNKKNLIDHGPIESHECICNMMNSRISLNVMPWFKAGAHDRIFNSMLSKSVSLSDSSTFVTDQFDNNKDIVIYSLAAMDKLPQIAGDILGDPVKAQSIAENGYQKTKAMHSWQNRAVTLSEYINRECFWT